ncbi:MAG: UxaA family hydrolase [Negativicutes bacterium]|nr:UxaA family hydrolase [Negativicutes bacterium]
MAKYRAIQMKAIDNVATVVEDIAAGTQVSFAMEDKTPSLLVIENIPFGHKFATREIAKGEVVMKYGESIGAALTDIKAGQHVHVHNIESCRGRGDKD